MSNGIAEAIDADGQLFGFERVLELVRSAYSVADVVAEAQRFRMRRQRTEQPRDPPPISSPSPAGR